MCARSTRKETIITTSWDDGSPLDIKLAKLLKKYNIPSTFYIPIKNLERDSINSLQIKKLSQDFDIGGHTLHHFDLTKLTQEMAWKEISECKKRLEKIINRDVISFCYPKGEYNYEIINMVKNAGFKGARNIRIFKTTINDIYQIGTTINVYDDTRKIYLLELLRSRDIRLFYFLLNNIKNKLSIYWDEIAWITLKYTLKYGGIWHLYGHSWEIENYCNWKKLRRLFEIIKETAETQNIRLINNSQLILEYSKNKIIKGNI